MTADVTPLEPAPAVSSARRWLPWMLGAVLFAGVVAGGLRASEAREFVGLAEQARPWWVVLALLCQGATYLAQAEAVAAAPRAAGFRLRRPMLWRLSLAKLFIDQTLPSAGVSGTVVVAAALQRGGVSRAAASAGAMINIASYYVAYVVALLLSLVSTVRRGHASVLVLLLSVLFAAFGVTLATAALTVSGRRVPWLPSFRRVPAVQRLITFVEDADPGLARNSRLVLEATGWKLAVVLLDAATLWVLIRSLGVSADAGGVFASLVLSSLFRIVGIVPGGLGTYEAASVLTLGMIGVAVPVALSATVLFRGLSFWLPMLPGLWFSRTLTRPTSRSADSIGSRARRSPGEAGRR